MTELSPHNPHPPHHTELPSTVIETFLNSSECIRAQLDWAERRMGKIKKDGEEYTQCLEDLRKAENAFVDCFGPGYLYGRRLMRGTR